MKNRWVYIPVIFSFLLLVAHFSRGNQYVFMVLSASIPFLLLLKKPGSRTIVQIALILGAAEWILSTLNYIEIRKAIGDDWQRLAIILFSVATFTLVSALLLYFLKPKE